MKIGPLAFKDSEFASQGNAILGIRDSGKSYTATAIAEQMHEAGVPFTAFDPIGIWRFLKVPASRRGGRGYPVIVAGGVAGDLPLSPHTAPAIVEAAMSAGASIVIDLFDINLSKAQWRAIVRDCVRLMLHKNKAHGLRHVFLEEAAEFAPQKVLDGDVYAEIEKLARMGGNCGLGYTLINQRSQEVNKAVLELCDNLFLHRQRGKNAIESLDKWLGVAGADKRQEIAASLPNLAQGECWAWIGGDKPLPPTLIRVGEKNSFHPDRRAMRGDAKVGGKSVNVSALVAKLQAMLPKIEAEREANDPARLRARIAELERAARKAAPPPAQHADKTELAAEFERGWKEGAAAISRTFAVEVARLYELAVANGAAWPAPPPKPTKTLATPTHKITAARADLKTAIAARAPVALQGQLGAGHMRILGALAFWIEWGEQTPDRARVAAVAQIANGGTFSTYLGALARLGLIELSRGAVSITDGGAAIAPPPPVRSVRAAVDAMIGDGHRRILDALPRDCSPITRDALAAAAGISNGGTLSTYLGKLHGMGVIALTRGSVALEPWLLAEI